MRLNETSRKFRIAVVLSAIWLVGTYVLAAMEVDRAALWLIEHSRTFLPSLLLYDRAGPGGAGALSLVLSLEFIVFGVLPLLVLWGIIWICAASNRK